MNAKPKAGAGSAVDDDRIVFGPQDVDLARSPLREWIKEETYVLGAFNPGLTRLPNGNLLMMVRVAEALRQPMREDYVLALRWADGRYHIDRFPRAAVNDKDPRQLQLSQHHYKTLILTSLSWLLPVELSGDGARIRHIHYDRIIAPERSFQEYGVEDARISRIGETWYMTTCSVSAERHCTALYLSGNGLDYRLEGVVLDHQNKDMLLFEGKVGGKFMALTRPLGEIYFAYPPESEFLPGPSIQFAQSPDALHWKPLDAPGIRLRRGSPSSMKIGGGTPPILTQEGWLTLYHGVEVRGAVGVYRTFWALLDRDTPSSILRLEDKSPLLEARPELSPDLDPVRYVSDIVFTTGIVADGEDYLIASGEDDLACRLTRMPKHRFA
jgi:beta-1,2-mannobiose phosphorylase / 1,2-beta-oligomannan phosphorylase